MRSMRYSLTMDTRRIEVRGFFFKIAFVQISPSRR